MAGNRIAEAFIELKVRGEQAMRSTLRKIKGETESVGKSFDKSLGKIGQRFEDATAGARKFQGAITGVLGIIGAVVGAALAAGRGIYELSQQLRSGADKAKEFVDALGDGRFRDVNKEAEALRDRIQEISNQLGAQGIAADIDRLLSGGKERLQDELKALVTELQRLNKSEQGAAERAQDRIDKEEAAKISADEEVARKAAEEDRWLNELRGRQYREYLRGIERDANETSRRIAEQNAAAFQESAMAFQQSVSSLLDSQSSQFTRLEDLMQQAVDRLRDIERRSR